MFGKLFTSIAAYFGQALLAIGVVSLSFLTRFTTLERKAYDQVNEDAARQKKIDLAVRWIQTAYRYRLYMKMNQNP